MCIINPFRCALQFFGVAKAQCHHNFAVLSKVLLSCVPACLGWRDCMHMTSANSNPCSPNRV